MLSRKCLATGSPAGEWCSEEGHSPQSHREHREGRRSGAMIEFFVYGILANLVAHYIIEAYEEVQAEREVVEGTGK